MFQIWNQIHQNANLMENSSPVTLNFHGILATELFASVEMGTVALLNDKLPREQIRSEHEVSITTSPRKFWMG